MMPVQCNRSTAEHAVPVTFRDRLDTVLLALDRIALAGYRFAVHDVDIRTGRNGATVRGQRIANHNDLANHQLSPTLAGATACRSD